MASNTSGATTSSATASGSTGAAGTTRTNLECPFCREVFTTTKAYNKHKKRVTACISWQHLNDLVKYYESRLVELHEYSIEINELLQNQKKIIADLSAKQMMQDEEDPIIWNEISIVASFLSANSKKSIKTAIKTKKEISDIKTVIINMFPNVVVTNVFVRKKNIEIILKDADAEECKVCFTNKIQHKPKCKTCKQCYICEECEYIQIKKYNRCAFCNTDY